MPREIATRAGPWLLAPAALYVAFLPLADTTVSLARIAAVAVAGALAAILPAAALLVLEARRGAAVAARALMTTVAAAVTGLAMTSGVGLWPLVVAAMMQVSAYGFGRHLADWLALDGDGGATWREAPLCVAVGWAVLLVAFLAAGTIGSLTRPVVVAVYLGGVVLAVRGVSRGRASQTRAVSASPDAPSGSDKDRPPSVAWWWGLALLVLIGYVGVVAPEVRHDALTAHLPMAREFAARAAIVEMRQNTASYFQINADLLYATAMALIPDERLPKFMHFGAGVLVCLVLYELGRRIGNRRAGLVGAGLFAGTPLVWWLAGTVYTDLWVALFSAAAVHVVLLYHGAPAPPRAFAAGLLAGAAVGAKISSAALAVPLLCVLLVRARTERRAWATLAVLIAGAALTGAYSYVRAWTLTGNPVFPLLRPIFGPQGGLHAGHLLRPLLGMGTGLWDLLLIPWRVTRFPERFVEDAGLGVAYLALLPLAVLAVARRRVPGWMTVTLVLAVLVWFWTSQYLRFALPLLPLVALVAGIGAADAPGGRGATATAATVSAALLALNAGAWAAPGPPNFPHTVAAGRVTRFAYAARYIPGFPVSEFAGRALPPDARIASAGDDRGYHYGRVFVPVSWYGRRFRGDLHSVVLAARSADSLRQSLTAEGFTHVVVVPDSPLLWPGREHDAWVTREAFWEDVLRLEYAFGGFYLFSLERAVAPRTRGPVLLDWTRVLVDGGGRSLEVPVRPETLYALEALVRAAVPGVATAMAIEWLSDQGTTIGAATTRATLAGPVARRRAVACTAPPGASRARITLSASGGTAVGFSNVQFYELR
ncbi:MAG: glycosyltransferase family 39 protein [Armatimonadota bacterium]|nr:glycosyltransferase family 39 protein [Armatimonadota bacterium]